MVLMIQCYGQLQALSNSFEHTLEVPEGATVADALTVLEARIPALANALPRAACAVGDVIVRRNAVLADNTVLVLLPPVGGG